MKEYAHDLPAHSPDKDLQRDDEDDDEFLREKA
jgi:hypothetical protein